MKSMFLVDANDTYDGEFKCIVKDGGISQTLAMDDKYSLKNGEEEFIVKFTFKALNNFSNKTILAESISLVDGKIEIDPATFNDLRMRAVLTQWNLTCETDEGEAELIPIDNDSINNLNPTISDGIIDIINEVLGFSMSV